MLTPEYLNVCTDDLVDLYRKFDESIVQILAKRIAKTNFVSDSSKWQAEILQQSGMTYDEVIAQIAGYTDQSDVELREMFEAAGIETIAADNEIYEMAGLTTTGLKQSAVMTQILKAGLAKTGGSLKNLTLTTANTVQTAYIESCNLAYMQISSGAVPYNDAVRMAVKSTVLQGTTVLYPSGHKDQLDVAVRRAALTGVNQTSAQIQLANAADMGCNLVEVTAHIGARPSHAEWQGQVYMIDGSSREYRNLAEATGYGTGEGLCGWNCRHNFYPYFEGIDMRAYKSSNLSALKNDGYYEKEQRQRALERQVRSTRRQLAGYDSAMKAASSNGEYAAIKQEFDRTSVKLKKQERTLKDYCTQNGLVYDSSRVQVYYGKGTTQGFNRSVSQKAVWANKRGLKYKDFDDIISLQGTLSNRDVREWYLAHDATIPDLIDQTATVEEQARQACELRNKFRTQARDLMPDQEERKALDISDPNRGFEELISDKMQRKKLTREEAITDILNTATKTRKSVNKKFGLE